MARLCDVRIRMYRQGFGDCFLITLPRADAAPLAVLVDCGVLVGTRNATEIMTRVARDISETTNGYLDLVVATHEHWDHVSGFLEARTVFNQMRIDEVWLAWTEDPADPLAGRLRQQRQLALRSLRAVAASLTEVDAQAAKELRGPLAFFGATHGPSSRDALDYLVNHPSRPRVRYHRPGGAPLELSTGMGTQVYVLGPPRDEALMCVGGPPSSDNVYELGAGLSPFAVMGVSRDDDRDAEQAQAFEPRHRVSADRAQALPFFQANYLRSSDDWRRIDADWLRSAEQLALALDDHTNNTSLALAFELEPSGRVLLFPGDAQVGNWQSWDNYRWQPAPPPAAAITVGDLLRRTVVYKVSHHGSHNATLRKTGLERMTSPDLVALLPVDREMAVSKRWKMPFPALLERIRELTRGRVLRSDESLGDQADVVGAIEWETFVERVAVGPDQLYYDYTV